MSTTRMIAIALIVLGILSFSYQGVIKFRTREKVVDAGPIQISADKTHRIEVPLVAGTIALIGGIVLLVTSAKRA